ncbi:MAG: M48 family metallopeptidase [Rhodobacteraceae bacterium]|nr:M48 family metallopeptidase [Paracoccaceae bacterium]
MADHVLAGEPPVALHLRRSARARRISLRVSQLDGKVTLTLPHRVPEAEALAFAESKAPWIRSHLDSFELHGPVRFDSQLPVEGRVRRIVPGRARGVVLTDDSIAVPGAAETLPARLGAFLRTRARERLAQASDEYAARLGRGYCRLTIRDTRSRWGSCSAAGALMFSWRLILAPPPVLRYVAAHEVAHLAEMNHAPAFWRTVEAIHGPYAGPRQWLRTHGAGLHRYRFDK